MFGPTSGPPASRLRTFTGAFCVSIDPDEADEDRPQATLDELIDFLKEAAVLDVDTEDNGNTLGVQGVELLLNTLEELPTDDVRH